jgi:hypothetical protein
VSLLCQSFVREVKATVFEVILTPTLLPLRFVTD